MSPCLGPPPGPRRAPRFPQHHQTLQPHTPQLLSPLFTPMVGPPSSLKHPHLQTSCGSYQAPREDPLSSRLLPHTPISLTESPQIPSAPMQCPFSCPLQLPPTPAPSPTDPSPLGSLPFSPAPTTFTESPQIPQNTPFPPSFPAPCLPLSLYPSYSPQIPHTSFPSLPNLSGPSSPSPRLSLSFSPPLYPLSDPQIPHTPSSSSLLYNPQGDPKAHIPSSSSHSTPSSPSFRGCLPFFPPPHTPPCLTVTSNPRHPLPHPPSQPHPLTSGLPPRPPAPCPAGSPRILHTLPQPPQPALTTPSPPPPPISLTVTPQPPPRPSPQGSPHPLPPPRPAPPRRTGSEDGAVVEAVVQQCRRPADQTQPHRGPVGDGGRRQRPRLVGQEHHGGGPPKVTGRAERSGAVRQRAASAAPAAARPRSAAPLRLQPPRPQTCF